MSSMMWGADVEALEELGRLFRSRGETVRLCYTQVRTAITQTPWEGEDGETFHVDWDGPHRARLDVVATGLITMGDDLIRQATEQRRASGEGGPGTGHTTASGDGSTSDDQSASSDDDGGYGVDDALGHALLALGIPVGSVEAILEALANGDIDPDWITSMIDSPALARAVAIAGPAIDIVSFVVDLTQGFLEHPELPFDEQLVYGLTVAGIGLGVGKGAEVIGGAIGSLLPVAGTAAGIVAGKVVGAGLELGYDYVDGKVGITEFLANNVLEQYQYAKAHDFNPASMAWDKGGDIVDGVKGGASDLAGGIKDGAGSIKDGAVDAVKDFPPWD
jgi:hypothetical protein